MLLGKNFSILCLKVFLGTFLEQVIDVFQLKKKKEIPDVHVHSSKTRSIYCIISK